MKNVLFMTLTTKLATWFIENIALDGGRDGISKKQSGSSAQEAGRKTNQSS